MCQANAVSQHRPENQNYIQLLQTGDLRFSIDLQCDRNTDCPSYHNLEKYSSPYLGIYNLYNSVTQQSIVHITIHV